MKTSIVSLLCLLLCFTLISCEVKQQPAFTTIWKTNNEGFGEDNQIVLPLQGKYTIEWHEVADPSNKGKREEIIDNVVLTFPRPGTYEIRAYGNITTMNFERYTLDDYPLYGTENYKLLSIESWGDIEWESFESFFYNCIGFAINTPEAPNLSKVTNTSKAFARAKKFNQSLSHWDVSNIQNMKSMFFWASQFNQPLESWNVSSVTNMDSMFGYTSKFNQPLNKWDVSNVTSMVGMFNQTSSFNGDITDWDVSNVTSMTGMFNIARKFNQPIGNWNTSKVTDFSAMFDSAPEFNQPIGQWNVSNGYSFMSMFNQATTFNQPLQQWDMANARDLRWMFREASAFNQALDEWNIPKNCIIDTGSGMYANKRTVFYQSGMSKENIVKTLKGWNREDKLELFLKETQKPEAKET